MGSNVLKNVSFIIEPLPIIKLKNYSAMMTQKNLILVKNFRVKKFIFVYLTILIIGDSISNIIRLVYKYILFYSILIY